MPLEYQIVAFDQWAAGAVQFHDYAHQRAGLAPESQIYGLSNPLGLVQYSGRELFQRVISFPVVAKYNNEIVGWALIYNVSDTAVRFQGIYVDPRYRNRGIGRGLIAFALALWPKPWNQLILLARNQAVDYFIRVIGMHPHPKMSSYRGFLTYEVSSHEITILTKDF